MQTEEFENENRHGFEDIDVEFDEDGYPISANVEPVGEDEYQKAIQLIIKQTKHPYGGFRYAQNLNVEGCKFEGSLPVVCMDGLDCVKGLTGSTLGDLVAVLAILNESRVQKLITGLYETKYPDLRRAFREWGKLQQSRG
jgi:hypothetical protein